MTTRFVSLAGDLDLVVGESNGTGEYSLLTYIENTGTSTAPVFVQQTGTANPFDGIDVGESSQSLGGRSSPTLGDLDGDGTLTYSVRRTIHCGATFCRSQAILTS